MADRENKTTQIETLIGLLLSGRELPPDFLESLQAWLIEYDEDAADKDAALENSFDDMVRTVTGKEYALESWPRLAEKLGMNPGLTEQEPADACTDRTHPASSGSRMHPAPHPVSPMRKKALQRRLIPYMAAALFCAAAIPAFLLTRQGLTEAGDPSFAPFTLATAANTDTLGLPDGSRVFVRENTTVSHAGGFTENRHITIDGEAFFSVAHDELHPFVVEGSEEKATVTGTEFYMRAFDAESHAEVAVAEGSVAVATGETSVILKANERATIDRINKTIAVTPIGDGELLRVRGESLLLEGVSLDRALVMIGGYFGLAVEIPSALPAIGGVVLELHHGATAEDAMFLLQAVNPVFDYAIRDSAISITVR